MTDYIKSTAYKLFDTYKKWIVENPQLLSDIETTAKCLSYFSVGHFNNSSVVLEIIYSVPNLIMLFNDILIYRNHQLHPKIPQYESKLKVWLTVLEYTQTLLEVSCKKIGGELGKWLIIAIIQLLKTILRLVLIHVYKERITKNPSTPPLNREKLDKISNNLEGFKLKRSGIVVRSIKHSDPVKIRTWKPLLCDTDENENLRNQKSNINLKLAESLYVMKPLLHLGYVSITSQKNWQPWILSLFIDIFSLHIFNKSTKHTVFNEEERLELTRRRISLLLYILRSPFYEKCSHTTINALLDKISTSIPPTKLLTSSLQKQLSYVQSMYFYMW